MSPLKLSLIGGSILAFIILFVMFLSRVSTGEMKVLYSDLDMEDSNKIIQELENKKIAYQLHSNGTVIKVPSDQVSRIRVSLAQIGVPNKGSVVGYEVFDKEDGISATNFSQNIKLLRALEGELARTISGLEQVEKCRVHLVLPAKQIFSQDKEEPRASLVLKFKKNKSLTKAEIEALSHLVVTAVPGLDQKNITIVDNSGKSLRIGTQEEDNFSGAKNDEYRVAYENRIKKIIEDLLGQSLGAGKVKAQVTAMMNFDRVVTNSEIYDPDSAVVRSTQVSDERESTPVASGEDSVDMSVANNLPNSGAEDSNKSNATVEKSEQTTNYEISRTVKNYISEVGAIKHLSIGILVDGTYKKNADSPLEYIPRTQEELEKIKNLVKFAVGFNEERNDQIEVINMQFSNDSNLPLEVEDNISWIREELPNLFQTVVFAIVVILVLITVIRPIALKAFEVRKGEEVLLAGLGNMPSTSSPATPSRMNEKEGDEDDIKQERRRNTQMNTHRVNEFIVSHPQETISILRKWFKENS